MERKPRSRARRGLLILCLIGSRPAFAAHPLVSDDAGVLGRGRGQWEVNAEHGRDHEADSTDTRTTFASVFSYGGLESLDVVLGAPLERFLSRGPEGRFAGQGLADASLEVKWRAARRGRWSLALKPGVTLPTGEESKGLGDDRPAYAGTLILSREARWGALHGNLAREWQGGRPRHWHGCVAAEVRASPRLAWVANAGLERETLSRGRAGPAFLLGGMILGLTADVDVDVGVKVGLNGPETDRTLLAGAAFRL